MEHVYKNSLLNIGATASRDSHGGLFFHREPRVVNPQVLEIGDESYVLLWVDLWFQSTEGSPLCQRAWVHKSGGSRQECFILEESNYSGSVSPWQNAR
jgi:hypothetical protein